MFMLLRVKVHPGFLFGDGLVVQPSYCRATTCSKGGLDEYHAAPPHRGRVGTLLNLRGHGGAARGARRRSLASVFRHHRGSRSWGCSCDSRLMCPSNNAVRSARSPGQGPSHRSPRGRKWHPSRSRLYPMYTVVVTRCFLVRTSCSGGTRA